MNVSEAYQLALRQRGYEADAAQLHAVSRLQQCYEEWCRYKKKRGCALARLVYRQISLPRGVYLWGGVGRGKSFLMDCFYTCVPIVRKTRVHFHAFMREVHRELALLRGQPDPLVRLASHIAKRFRLICFDEFHISDVGDAMILHGLLVQLFAHRVQFVMTSNYRPDALYPDGLHRDRVLPAIALLYEYLDILNVDQGTDYRLRTLAQAQAYLTPAGLAADKKLDLLFSQIAEVADEESVLYIEARQIHAYRRAGGVVWFRFDALCAGARSQNDYLEIASQFHTVILSDIPVMSPRMASEARRFTWLIDVLYDNKIKLLISAAAPAQYLYTEGSMAHEFARTVSRIIEMQSYAYLDAPKERRV
ncbi:MAG: AFG1 family ATPase [Ottowia sp.]|nr:AFG1 family ATPase [Ottowia sp.]